MSERQRLTTTIDATALEQLRAVAGEYGHPIGAVIGDLVRTQLHRVAAVYEENRQRLQTAKR